MYLIFVSNTYDEVLWQLSQIRRKVHNVVEGTTQWYEMLVASNLASLYDKR